MHSHTWGYLAALATFGLCFLTAHILGALGAFDRQPSALKPARLGCIDGLRGYLALGVFLHHFFVTHVYKLTGEWVTPSDRFFRNCGDAGVSLFFMITGFLFLNRLLDGRRMEWKRFFIARVFRLYPLYLACAAAVFVIVFTVGGPGLREPPFALAKKIAGWVLFLAPDINRFPDTFTIIAGVTWTLRYEWLFYLALPLVAWTLRGRAKILLVVLAALTLFFYARPARIPFIGSTEYFVLFWAGGLTAHAHRFEALKRILRKPLFSGIAVAALLAVLFGFDNVLDVAPLLLMTVFFVPVALGNSLGGLLERRASILLGDVSYGIYLLHGFVLFLAFSVFAPRALQSADSPAALWLWMPALGIIVVLLAWLAHRFIERPGIALGKRFPNRPAARHA
jgi:peptidoglycan/LPS O-acetylase OafA/YrhL